MVRLIKAVLISLVLISVAQAGWSINRTRHGVKALRVHTYPIGPSRLVKFDPCRIDTTKKHFIRVYKPGVGCTTFSTDDIPPTIKSR